MKRHVLVTGGAGYIGSHMVKRLLQAGHVPIVIDDLSAGHREAVSGATLYECSTGDATAVDAVCRDHAIDAVMHFAGSTRVGESVSNPGKYYENNTANTARLLKVMARHGVDKFVFSSTCAIFGNPVYTPIDERHPKNPINPYGWSKLMAEQVLSDYGQAHGIRSICLRYFNAAGADPDGTLGECHDPETHLIPLVLQAASGRREAITILGSDYDTPDGTCIRDYVHVEDLCNAHLLALDRLFAGGESGRYNLGCGRGYSVEEVIATAERVTGRPIARISGDRRPGDPPTLIANPTLARQELNWMPARPDLETMIRHAWIWEQKICRVRA